MIPNVGFIIKVAIVALVVLFVVNNVDAVGNLVRRR